MLKKSGNSFPGSLFLIASCFRERKVSVLCIAMYGQTVRAEVRRPFWYEYIAMYGQTVRGEVIFPSGTSMGNQGGGMW